MQFVKVATNHTFLKMPSYFLPRIANSGKSIVVRGALRLHGKINMEILRTIAALLGFWSGAMLIVCWTFLEWAKMQEEQPIELKEEWVVNDNPMRP